MEISINSNIALSDTGFLFNPSSGESFNANEMGVCLLRALMAGDSLKSIIETLGREYDVDPLTLHRDVEDFVMMLKVYKIVQ